ncbi:MULTISPECIES: hypothetical protein [unclassified Streptomyces]|uniref:hypothetical protein n=1 Tax=unclassified Streptomyces TaxID=2593676 RepID=UPI00093D28EB|nr:hypothetical protein [Streptomyces sp. CB02058]OKI87491.1 hypothetical protein AMK10_34420 [Streptomyces sp. CB02058]
MDDLLLTLAVPAVVLASGVYAVCDCRRRRRKPPPPYTRRASALAARETVDRAEAVVDRAYAALGRLYADPATPHPADGSPTVSGAAGSSRDRGPFRPASARRP